MPKATTAVPTAHFQRVASYLFKSMQFDGNPAEQQSSGYTLTLDNRLQVHLIGIQPEFLVMLCIVGHLPAHASAATLTKMLHAIALTFAYPSIILGMEKATQEITVWTRQRLSELDEQGIAALFNRFVDMTDLLRRWLARGGDDGKRKLSRPTVSTIEQLSRRFSSPGK
jgi:hypothetical protein